MKFNVEINSTLIKVLLVVVLVLLTLNLGKSLFNVKDVVANGFYEEDPGQYIVQNLNKYPDLHLFKRTGKVLNCVGKCVIDEKTNTSTWVTYKKVE
jgi:hypothetical protein